MRISESCSALVGVLVSFVVYPFFSNISLMAGMSLLVTNSSSFLLLRFGGQMGGLRVWVRRLMALRSPAVAIRYLPLTAILDVSDLRVMIWYGTPALSVEVMRVSAASRQYPSPCIHTTVVIRS